MNVKHIYFVHTVAHYGSIHKAAKKLFITQPNLTSAILKLESNLGITIFNRSPKGVELTNEGNEFLIHTKPILNHIEYVENIYKENNTFSTQYFSVSCQRFKFVLDAFLEVRNLYKDNNINFTLKDVCTFQVIHDVENSKADLGVFLFTNMQEKFLLKLLNSKNLNFGYINIPPTPCAILHKNHELSKRESVTLEDLKKYTLVAFADETMYNIGYLIEYNFAGLRNMDNIIQVYDKYSFIQILSYCDSYGFGMEVDKTDPDLVSIPIENLDLKYKCVWIHKNSVPMSQKSKDIINILNTYYQ